jgi:hypothetical protein
LEGTEIIEGKEPRSHIKNIKSRGLYACNKSSEERRRNEKKS